MKLIDRAKKLAALGFFDGLEDVEPATLVAEAEEELEDMLDEAPATALLLVSGAMLEIEADAAAELDGYRQVLEEVAEFCEGIFEISAVRADFVPDKQVLAAGEESGSVVSLRFKINGESHEMEVTHYPDIIDLGFLGEINAWLERNNHPKRLCPVVELMDDMARYVFVAPDAMEQAELAEIITAPDFEDDGEE